MAARQISCRFQVFQMSGHPPNPFSGLSLFVHDDAPYSRHVLRSLFTSEGFRMIHVSEDFTGFVERIWALRPDIVLLSWEPWQDDRIALLREIRAGLRNVDPELRVLASTACAQSKFIRALAGYGVNGVLLKPFSRKTVMTQIHRMGQQRQEILAQRIESGALPFDGERAGDGWRRPA
jgi:DNA-binding NarL/FixJ family response regulator